MNKKLVLLGTSMLLAAGVSAQTRVTGRVVGEDGTPVYGATVRVEGHKGITVTDENGRFTLQSVPASAKRLKISYIGKSTETVSVAGNVDVVLKDDDAMLEEAVVIGYGTGQKLGTVVGSVSKVGGDKIEGKPVANAIDALQGQVAGLSILSSSGDPGAALTGGFSANIRGIGSLSAGSEPLFVLDGVPTSSSVLGMMNPDDIAEVTVLKGASATSIYGSRASNGVIFITSKRGRAGERAIVNVSQSIGWSSLARRIGNPMTATELLDLRREFGLISGDEYQQKKQSGINTDWQKYNYVDDAPMYQTNFSIRGGSEKTTYFTSASYFKQDGITPGSKFKRITFRTNVESKPLKWLGYGANMSVSYDERTTSANTYNGSNYLAGGTFQANFFDPTWTPYGENGERLDKYQTTQGEFYSPEYMAKYNPSEANDIRAIGSAFLNINPIEGLNFRSQLSMDAVETRSYAKLLPSHFDAAGYGYARESFSRSVAFTITNTAEYKFRIGEDVGVTLLAGQEGIRGTADGFSAASRGQSNDKITTLGNGLEISGLPSSSSSEYQYLSFFGRADVSLYDKYYLNFSARNDRSSRFGKNNNDATFLSGGVMWDIKKEYFMRPVEWLNELKIRADYGSTGNSSIGDYAHLSLAGNTQFAGNYGYVLSTTGNEDLTWEKQIQASVGIEARIFNRANLSATWYTRKTKDMLMAVPVPYTTGFSSKVRNVGEMVNKGVEIEFDVDVLRTRDFYVNVRANYSYNQDEITKLFNGLDEWVYSGTGIMYKVGGSVEYYSAIYAGVDKNTGEQMWYKKGYSGDPVYEYNPETMTKTFNEDELAQSTGKKRFAPHNGGFGLTASWKGLTLMADFNFVLGKYMLNNDRYFSNNPYQFLEQFNQDKEVLKMWRKPGDETLEPAYGSIREFDTHLLENASFMRLKTLTLSYSFPEKWLAPTRIIKGFNIKLTGRNLFTVTKYQGPDPEVNSNVSMGTYPNTRQYTIGAELTF